MSPARRRTALAFVLAWMLLVWPLSCAIAAAPVLVVTSERGGAYDESIDALRDALASSPPYPSVADIDWQDFADIDLAGARVVVTVGSQAAQAVALRDAALPVLNILVPRVAFETLHDGHAESARHSAVFLDQPVSRQIAAIIEALPGWTRLALIAGPHTRALVTELSDAARAAGFDVRTADIDSERELYAAMRQTLAAPAILVAVPDRQIYNSHTIQNILLTSYRQRSPLVGFSPAYVRAGALLGLYSTPAQIAAQAADAVRSALAGGGLPPPRYPERFEIGINTTVARSLGLELATTDAIAARVAQREAQR